jgi:DNA-binding MarR family transcriptional regulator
VTVQAGNIRANVRGRKLAKTANFYRSENYSSWGSAGYLLKTASHLLQPCLEEALRDSGLTVTQWKVLMCLRDELASTCADISRELPHDSGSLTRIVDDLEKMGYLERQRSTSDRRMVALNITPTGRVAVAAGIPYVVKLLNSALQDLTRAEIVTLVDVLQKVVARLRQIGADAGQDVAKSRGRSR